MENRQYFIDWTRVIAIALLMVYHVAIVFQPWGLMVGFITNAETWESLWPPMTMLNVWRIPILFFVAGIGFCYSFKNRDWKKVLTERGLRIGLPYVFGIVAVTPVYLLILQKHYDWKVQYTAQSSHLWFLGNILCYIALTIVPFCFLKKAANSLFATGLSKLVGSYLIFLIVIVCFVIETLLVHPPIYEMYALTNHGFILGLLAFIFGYLFAFSGDEFWNKLVKIRWLFLMLSILFFTVRSQRYIAFHSQVNLPVETCLWIFTMLAFANKYLNFSNKFLSYFSKAAYPIYIIHMIFLGLSCNLLIPLKINAQLKFCGVLMCTVGGSLLFYEVVKRIKYLRLLFGIKN